MANQHFVLVHGACSGAWCWFKVLHLLKSAGHRVTNIDLAASGTRCENPFAINTLDELAAPLMKLMASIPADQKVILVGHGFGGFSLALAMENYPDKVNVAVFLSAYMPDVTHNVEYIRDIEQTMGPTIPTRAILHSKKLYTMILFDPLEMAILYRLCSIQDLQLAKMMEKPTPELKSDFSARKFSGEGYGSVKRVYMMASSYSFSIDFQEWQINNFPPDEVKVIEGADHMSMISKPQELCKSLLDVAQKYV